MSKFIIECPHCGSYQEASTGFFSRKILECKCGNIINIKKDRFTLRECAHCGNTVLFDQAKGDKATCPVCKSKLITPETMNSFAFISCPSCSCELQVHKGAKTYVCPLCKETIDVQSAIEKEKLKKKDMPSVIKYEGPNDVLVWKHPIEDFALGSQLIVHESQEAIFFRDGQALDCFGAGRHTLTTEKLPLIKNLYKLPFDANKAFHSEVYFINLVTQTGIKWGTDTKVRMFDPASGLSVELGAYGEFTLRVLNSRKLLVKLVGTTPSLNNKEVIDNPYDIKVVSGKFKGLIISKVKTILAKHIKLNSINILEVDENVELLSKSMKEEINQTLEEYGMTMPEFYVLKVVTPDDDPNFKRLKEQYAEQYLLVREEQIKKNVALAEQQRRVVEAQTGAQEEIIAAQAKAEAYRLQAEAEAKEMQMKGYTYQQETQRKVGVTAMEHLPQGGGSGSSSVVGDVVGLGVTLGAVGSVMGMTKEAISPIAKDAAEVAKSFTNQAGGWICPNCGKKDITSNFCPDCGTKKPAPATWDCKCGEKNITSNYCPNCGKKKGE